MIFCIFISLIIQFVNPHETIIVPKAGVPFSNELSNKPPVVGTLFVMEKLNLLSEDNNFTSCCGIYVVTNLLNKKQYVGMSNNIRRRFWEHLSKSKTNRNAIYQAIRKYGIENFSFEILEDVTDINLLCERERYWISELKPRYNMNKGGMGNSRRVSEETKEKLRVKAKAQWENKSEDEKLKTVRDNLTGPKASYKMPESQKNRLRELQTGRKKTPEYKNKMSKIMTVRMIGNKNGNKKIECYKNGVKINEFQSAVEGAAYCGIHPSTITHHIKENTKSAAGFQWKYSL